MLKVQSSGCLNPHCDAVHYSQTNYNFAVSLTETNVYKANKLGRLALFVLPHLHSNKSFCLACKRAAWILLIPIDFANTT